MTTRSLLIIISGNPGAGKTTLGKKIAKKFNLPLISRDNIKEALFDSLGIKDRDWSTKLGAASYKVMYRMIESLLISGQSLIVESNFSPKFDDQIFQNLQAKYHFLSMQLFCFADKHTLLKRFKNRWESGERHPGHADHQDYDEIKDVIIRDVHQPLDLEGKIAKIDTTDFSAINYDQIFTAIKSLIIK
ncbi:MAG: AAA family ATPase [Patescibacteria group bacterium]